MMTEFDYDCYLKKQLARQAKHKKGGSKSKRCTFSSDHLTRKQWSDLCGPVMKYDMGSPVTRRCLESWPHNIQQLYISGLVERYGASFDDIANLLGVDYQFFIDNNLLTTSGCNEQTDEQKTQWEEFLMKPVLETREDLTANDYPIDWKTFRFLDPAIQIALIHRWQTVYNASGKAISEMLGIRQNTFSAWVRKNLPDIVFYKGKTMTEAQIFEWKNFMTKPGQFSLEDSNRPTETAVSEVPDPALTEVVTSEVSDTASTESEIVDETATTILNKVVEVPQVNDIDMHLGQFAITFQGKIDLSDVVDKLMHLAGDDNLIGVLKIQFDPS